MLSPFNYKLILKTTEINLIKSTGINVTAKLSITVDINVRFRSTCSYVWFYDLFEKILTLFGKIRPISEGLTIIFRNSTSIFEKFVRPNQNFRSGRAIASVGLSQCVHANVFIVLNLVAATLGEIRSTLFRYFACSVNAA